MSEKKKVAVVILNWNGEKMLNTFLPSVVRFSDPTLAEIIVADNGSTDMSVGLVKNNFPSVRVIRLDQNYGFAGGYNKAIEQVDAEILVLLNSDVEVTPGWIEEALKMLDNNPEIAAVQPRIMSYSVKNQFEYAGAAGGYIDKYGYPFCKGRILNQIETDEGQYSIASRIFWASGACMFIRAGMFRQAGGFDSDFWAHMEEIDLCWRINNMGHEIWYQPQSIVYHLGGGTLSYDSPLKIHLNFRNNLWMLFKNLPKKDFKRIFITRLILDGVAALKFLAGLHFTGFWAVIKAHVAFYSNWGKLKKKRKLVQQQIITDQIEVIYKKSIMWKFFIEGKKKFSELKFD